MKVEDFVKEHLDQAEKKLEILSEDKLSDFLVDYVSKEVKQALTDGVATMLERQQKVLINRRNDDGEARVTTGAQVREIVQEEANRRDRECTNVKKRKEYDDDDDSKSEGVLKTTAKPVKSLHSKTSAARKQDKNLSHQKFDKITSLSRSRGQNQRNISIRTSDKSKGDRESDADIIVNDDDEYDYDKTNNFEDVNPKEVTLSTSHRKTQLFLESSSDRKSTVATMAGHSRARKKRASFPDDSDDEQFGGCNGVDDDWGTANTKTEKY